MICHYISIRHKQPFIICWIKKKLQKIQFDLKIVLKIRNLQSSGNFVLNVTLFMLWFGEGGGVWSVWYTNSLTSHGKVTENRLRTPHSRTFPSSMLLLLFQRKKNLQSKWKVLPSTKKAYVTVKPLIGGEHIFLVLSPKERSKLNQTTRSSHINS